MPFKMESLIALGITFIFIGFIVVLIGMLIGTRETASKTRLAVGGFIGFIPFGFGNDKKLVWFVAIISLAVFLIWMLFSLRYLKIT